jgi:hypothetical protein
MSQTDIVSIIFYAAIAVLALYFWRRNDAIARYRYDNVWKDKQGRNFRHSHYKMLLTVWRNPKDFL